MRFHFSIVKLLSASMLCSCALALGAAETAPGPAHGPMTLANDLAPVLKEYCFDCHNPDKQKGDVDLTEAVKNPKLLDNREIWSKVIEQVESGDMPPTKKPHPSDEQRDLIVHFLDGELSKLDCTEERNPGRVTIRRLNRREYRNTIRELLHVEFEGQDFPSDEVGYGFDNIGDVLSLSPMLMEKYLAAAEEIAGKAIVLGTPKPQVRKWKGQEFELSGGVHAEDDGVLSFFSMGEATHGFDVPKSGEYTVRIRAYGDQAGTELPRLSVRVDKTEVKTFDVKAIAGTRATYEAHLPFEKGWRKLGFAFTNDYYDDKNPDPKLRGDRNLYVESVEIVMPAGDASYPESHRRLITKMPEPGQEQAVARELIAPFLKRAYRRPVTAEEVERVARFVDLAMKNKGSFLEGMQVAVQAALCAPEFLYRWELDPGTGQAGGIRELNDYEVASRLSYFLWSSMPDEELLSVADKGMLRKDGNLEKQINRMLHNWRIDALAESFAAEWLQIRNIDDIIPDPNLFPKWNDDLRGPMQQEAKRFFRAIVEEDRSVLDFLTADYTFVNERLASYYGLPGVKGKDMQRVQLPPDSPRGGVLTMAAVLMATSTPTRTSPVIRGKWILEQILGTPPPSPPANVPPLGEQTHVNQTAALRQRLEQHVKDSACAACHKRMDPLGLALENFDAVGGWRDKDGKFPIDPSGKLPDGRKFNGPRDLKQVLSSGDGFVTNLSEKLLTYALGRGLGSDDLCAIKGLVTKTKANGNKFSALVTAVVTSDPFLKRKAADALTKN